MTTSHAPFPHAAGARGPAPWFIVEGVLLILLGVLAAALPGVAGLAAAIVFGWILIVSGILGLVSLLGQRGHAHLVWSAISAIIALVAGVLVLLAPIAGAVGLALFIAAYLFLDAVTLIGLALDQRRRERRAWGWLIVAAVVDFLLAGFIVAMGPLSMTVLLGFVIAVDLIMAGVALIALGVSLRQSA